MPNTTAKREQLLIVPYAADQTNPARALPYRAERVGALPED